MRKPKALPDRTCPVCGKRYNRRRFGKRLEDASRYLSRKTCGKSCGSTKDAPSHRASYCRRAGKAKGQACQACGARGPATLLVHHKNGDIQDNRPRNLKTLCFPCHARHHWRLRRRGVIFGAHKREYGAHATH